ncbi:MAG: hypothetical protein Sapg2KO_28780 [Saprospiraceae bacterium]
MKTNIKVILILLLSSFLSSTVFSQDGIRIIKLKCTKTSENGEDEVYLKINGKKLSRFDMKAGATKFINYETALVNSFSYALELWEHDNDYDDKLGVLSYMKGETGLPGIEGGTSTRIRSKRMTGDGGDYTLYFQYVNQIYDTPINSVRRVNPRFLAGDDMSSKPTAQKWLKTYTKGWMSKLPGTTKLSDVSLPGTHNAAARYGGVAPECQSWTIKEQLNAGIRYFDIRVSRFGNNLLIFHGDFYQKQTFDTAVDGNPAVFDEFKNFLDANPGETIVLKISSAGTPTEKNLLVNTKKYNYNSDWKELFDSEFVLNSAKRAYFYSDQSNKNPTLSKLRKKIFLTHKVNIPAEKTIKENHYKVYFGVSGTFNHCKECLALPDKKTAVIQGNMLRAITETTLLEVPGFEPKWYMNGLNGAYGMTPINCADHVNEAVFEFLDRMDFGKRKLGWIMMDYPGEHLIYRIIQSNFDLNQEVQKAPTVQFQDAKMVFNNFGSNQGWTTNNHVRTMADVNGDGKADIVGFTGGGVLVALSNGRGFDKQTTWIANFGSNQDWTTSNQIRTMADVNGDGKADIVGFTGGGVLVALSNGRGFDKQTTWIRDYGSNQGWMVKSHLRTLSDVNGDGKADIVGFTGGGALVALSTGTGFARPKQWINNYGINQGWNNAKHDRALGDINGDGNTDIVGFSTEVRFSLSNPAQKVFSPAKGAGNNVRFGNGPYNKSKHLRTVGDVNGDGKADIVGFGEKGVFVSLSKGNGTFESQKMVCNDLAIGAGGWTIKDNPRYVADVNGDGKVDLVGFGKGGVFVAFAK